jgi:hypothetical protein
MNLEQQRGTFRNRLVTLVRLSAHLPIYCGALLNYCYGLTSPMYHDFREINGFLLIEPFRKLKLWPPGFDPWWPFLYVRINK